HRVLGLAGQAKVGIEPAQQLNLAIVEGIEESYLHVHEHDGERDAQQRNGKTPLVVGEIEPGQRYMQGGHSRSSQPEESYPVVACGARSAATRAILGLARRPPTKWICSDRSCRRPADPSWNVDAYHHKIN